MVRREGWETRLAQVVEAARNTGFDWGAHDCCAFAARCVEALTGTDFRRRFPSYATRSRAIEILRGHGGVAGLATHCLGEPVPPEQAGRGDVVLVSCPEPMLAVCVGEHVAAPSMLGLVFVSRAQIEMAWKV